MPAAKLKKKPPPTRGRAVAQVAPPAPPAPVHVPDENSVALLHARIDTVEDRLRTHTDSEIARVLESIARLGGRTDAEAEQTAAAYPVIDGVPVTDARTQLERLIYSVCPGPRGRVAVCGDGPEYTVYLTDSAMHELATWSPSEPVMIDGMYPHEISTRAEYDLHERDQRIADLEAELAEAMKVINVRIDEQTKRHDLERELVELRNDHAQTMLGVEFERRDLQKLHRIAALVVKMLQTKACMFPEGAPTTDELIAKLEEIVG